MSYHPRDFIPPDAPPAPPTIQPAALLMVASTIFYGGLYLACCLVTAIAWGNRNAALAILAAAAFAYVCQAASSANWLFGKSWYAWAATVSQLISMGFAATAGILLLMQRVF